MPTGKCLCETIAAIGYTWKVRPKILNDADCQSSIVDQRLQELENQGVVRKRHVEVEGSPLDKKEYRVTDMELVTYAEGIVNAVGTEENA